MSPEFRGAKGTTDFKLRTGRICALFFEKEEWTMNRLKLASRSGSDMPQFIIVDCNIRHHSLFAVFVASIE
jgi:hypothetical protein